MPSKKAAAGLFGRGEFYRDEFLVTTAAVLILLCAGLTYFARAEARTIAER